MTRTETPDVAAPVNHVPPPKPHPSKPQPYPADKARGAELDLQTPARKIIFFGGLIGTVILVFLLQFMR